jgi:Predicted dehydrogenases and related proteins
MKKVKIGVVGTGHLGSLHVKMLKNIENAELVGVYDSSYEKSETCAREQGVKKF